MKINNNGFGLVETLLIIVVLGTLAGTGVYTYRHRETSQSKTSTVPTTQKPTSTTQTSSPELSRAAIAKAPASKVKFSQLPKELQAAAKTRISEVAPGCINSEGELLDYDHQPVDPEESYAPIGSALIGIGCDGGAIALFAKDKSGDWIHVSTTQQGFTCDQIFTYPVPKQLLELHGAEAGCYEESNDTFPTYDEALNTRFY